MANEEEVWFHRGGLELSGGGSPSYVVTNSNGLRSLIELFVEARQLEEVYSEPFGLRRGSGDATDRVQINRWPIVERTVTLLGQHAVKPQRSTRMRFLVASLGATLLGVGCRSLGEAPAMLPEFPTGGWHLRQGQAVWKASGRAPEIAGELTLATHPTGAVSVEFAKPPISLVVAQRTASGWRIESPNRSRAYAGRGQPPHRIVWFVLARCLQGSPAPRGWTFERHGPDAFLMRHERSGQSLEGYLAP